MSVPSKRKTIMATQNFKELFNNLTYEELLQAGQDLQDVFVSRKQEELDKARAELEATAKRLGVSVQAIVSKAKVALPSSGSETRGGKGQPKKPKFIGPKGETWAGTGQQPSWLKALIAEGHTAEEYAVK